MCVDLGWFKEVEIGKAFSWQSADVSFMLEELTLWKDGAGLGTVVRREARCGKSRYAAVAQYLVEHMVEAHGVGSSSLPGGTT